MDKMKKELSKKTAAVLNIGICFLAVCGVCATFQVLSYCHFSSALEGFSGTVEIESTTEKADIIEIIEAILLWLLEVSGSIALLILIVAGVMYITSAGNEQRVATAKKIFTFTVLGLSLILLSYSIIVVLRDILT